MEDMVINNDFWQNRRVLVTGASGLVGTWLVRSLLAKGSDVVAMVHNPDPQSEFFRSDDYKHTSLVHGELEDILFLERTINKYEIESVFHLAAQPIVGVAHRAPLQTFEANIRGTYNLLEVCRQHHDLVKRIVVASSDKAYGTQPVLPYTEEMSLAGRYPYEVSKSCSDMIAQSYFHAYGVPVAIARCGNIYGGGDLNWSRIVPDTVRSCLQGVPVVIRSDGTFLRDYVYVKDVTNAYMSLGEHLEDEHVKGYGFNFGPERPVSVLELVKNIQKLIGCEHLEPVILNNAQGEIHSQYLDSTKAREILGWKPQYSLDAGLTETIEWYRNYLNPIELN